MDIEKKLKRQENFRRINYELKNIISYNVKYYRTLKGITEDELGECIGKTGEYIKKLENKQFKANPPIDTLDMIARALEVRISELICKDNTGRKNE